MAESVVKLRVDSQEYDSKIKRAADGLRAFGENCQKAGESVSKADKATLDYVRAIGQMETVSKNAKGKVNEMTAAFTELSVQYRTLTEQERQSPFGRALAQSLDQLKTRIKSTKDELSSITAELNTKPKIEIPSSGGGLFGGKLDGMLAVFGGNMMTKAAGWAASLVSGMGDAIQQGIELAKAGEGVRIAFERLNRPDLLDNLREATHGTVTDLELMKQAVKFNDFNLSLDEMGTMLAFAQQKAKDTGQSVDYMVDSIVTGLGRKSLMILDNLGLSAADIKEKMKSTGDMTKAVGEIIREQMGKAGDYIETTADRAARADAEVKNAMEELGRTFQPLADAGSAMFQSLEIGALNLLNRVVKPLIDNFTTLGRLRKEYASAGGSDRVKTDIERFRNNSSDSAYKVIVAQYDREIQSRQRASDAWHAWRSGDRSAKAESEMQWAKANYGTDTGDINAEMNAWKKMRSEFVAGAKEILNPVKDVVSAATTPTGTTTTASRVGRTTTTTQAPPPAGSIAAQEAKVQALTKAWREATDEVGRAGYAGRLEEAKRVLEEMQGKTAVPSGSLKDLNGQLSELRKERELLSDPISLAVNEEEIARVQEKIDSLTGKTKEPVSQSVSSIRDQVLSSLVESRQSADANALSNLLKVTIENGLDGIDIDSEHLEAAIFGKYGDAINIPDEYWEGLTEKINAQLASLGIDPITIDVKTGEVTKAVKEVKDGWDDASRAVQAVGNALQQIEDPSAKIAGIVGEAIANIALGFAQATSKSSGGGVLAWIAAIAGGMGTMLGTISAIKSATAGSYAEGGIVPGNNYNDGLIANVSSGELILNRAQQNNIANQLTGNGNGNLHLEASFRGEDLRIAMTNSNKRRGRGEYAYNKK